MSNWTDCIIPKSCWIRIRQISERQPGAEKGLPVEIFQITIQSDPSKKFKFMLKRKKCSASGTEAISWLPWSWMTLVVTEVVAVASSELWAMSRAGLGRGKCSIMIQLPRVANGELATVCEL